MDIPLVHAYGSDSSPSAASPKCYPLVSDNENRLKTRVSRKANVILVPKRRKLRRVHRRLASRIQKDSN